MSLAFYLTLRNTATALSLYLELQAREKQL